MKFLTAFALSLLLGLGNSVQAQEPATAPKPLLQLLSGQFGAASFPVGYLVPEGGDLDTEVPTPGYSPEQAWLYQQLPDATTAAKLGLGFYGVPSPHPWRKLYRPQPLPRRNLKELKRLAATGLPAICDLAIDPAGHGHMQPMSGVKPLDEYWPSPASDSIPYSVTSDDARALWLSLWESDAADYVKTFGQAPGAYRLFARAQLWDSSSYIRMAAMRLLRQRFSTIDNFNKITLGKSPLASFSAVARFKQVDDNPLSHAVHASFLEDCFSNLVSLAAAKFAPTPVFYQPLEPDQPGIDDETATLDCALLCAPATTHTPILTALYMRALAAGRPVLSPEVTPSATPALTRDALLTQLARGYSAALLAPARRTPRAWLRYMRSPETGRTVQDPEQSAQAGRAFAAAQPSNWLNPFAVPPSSVLDGLAQAKTALAQAAPLFPTTRPSEAKLAILHSRASQRLRSYKRASPLLSLDKFVDACHFAFLPTELLLERRLTKGIPPHLRVLLVPETDNACLAETPELLLRWVEAGGTLLLNPKALTVNEWNNALSPSPFESYEGTLPDFPEVRFRKLGAGRILCFEPGPDIATLSQRLIPLLRALGIDPVLQCTAAEGETPVIGIEWARAPDPTTPGAWNYLLFNRTTAALSFDAALPSATGAADAPAQRLTLAPQECALVRLAP